MKNFRKFLALAIVGVLILAPVVYSQTVTATFGDKNSSNEYRVKADVNGVVTFAADTGIKYPHENYNSTLNADSATNTIVAAETGKFIIDRCGITDGVTTFRGGSKHTLPTAVAGMQYTLIAGGQCFVTLDVQDMDSILFSASSTGMHAGDSLKSTGQAGDAVTVVSPAAGKWAIQSMTKTWTDNGTN